MGVVRPRGGRVHLGGQALSGQPSDRVAKAGRGRVAEGRQGFPNRPVREYRVATAADRRGATSAWARERVWRRVAGLQERQRHYGNQLSGGEQQMLAIGRALGLDAHAIADPRAALDEAVRRAGIRSWVLVTGSLHLVGALRRHTRPW
jgi:ABC-type branched-subunit amino acid transport system ATPase component